MTTEASPGAVGGWPATWASRPHHEDRRAAVSGTPPSPSRGAQDPRISICEADGRAESPPKQWELTRGIVPLGSPYVSPRACDRHGLPAPRQRAADHRLLPRGIREDVNAHPKPEPWPGE
ncbi:hypothetical protein GCM10019016_104940 [Streptomyces prasinosporus]|uniref:Uncharacterized protein n=1 Tax=Streptomyces prasinosporus TaxID=68256 RepID=A0ABP6U7G5_9ACTN